MATLYIPRGSGKEVFRWVTVLGVPLEICYQMLHDRGMGFDLDEYYSLWNAHRSVSRW